MMSRLFRRKTEFGDWQAWLLGVPVVLVVVFLSYLIVRPDPAASQFYRAQKLQSAGQGESALRLYSLIVSSLPHSSFAPLALQQKGEILTGMARRSGDAEQYRAAIEAYARLATDYSSHSLAGEALLSAGSLAANDLRDAKTASGFYQTLLNNYPANPEYGSEATLRLGRLALQNGDGNAAKNYFTRVLQEYSRFSDRCAQAQYYLGMTYETLLKNKASARSAYEATIKKWPSSVWASDAKERLGMLLYANGGAMRPARKVLLQIGSLPATGGDSRLSALRLLLAARGMDVSDAVFRGWSLSPFRAGFSPANPARTLDDTEDFSTIAANAGLVYSRKSYDDAAGALSGLRDELDAGHAPFVSLDGWALIVGYDSSRAEVFAQHPGGERTTLTDKEFSNEWRKSGYKFLSFHAPSETLKATTPPKSDGSAPELVAPLYLYKLPALSVKNAHRRVLRNAVSLMKRPREDGVLLNLEALRAMVDELETLGSAMPESPLPIPEETGQDEADTPDEGISENAPVTVPTPAPTPAAPTSADSFERRSTRWKSLRKWFDGPVQQWIATRRDAAAYLDSAANDLNDARLREAAAQYRESVRSLERALSTLPAAGAFENDPEGARAAMDALARDLASGALKAETRATALMAVSS